MSSAHAIIITIGDELLIGQTIDTNSAWLAQQLNSFGVDVAKRVAVGDDASAITTALDDALTTAKIVIMTGGLGPTSDDITKPLLCNYFGGKLVTNEAVLTHVKELFARRNRPILPVNLKQAEVPDNCTVLFNKMGTAPGMWFQHGDQVVIALPGVPFEMKAIMEQEGIPALKRLFSGHHIVHRTLFTAGEGESFIAQKLTDFEAQLPAHIGLAYLPDSGMVRLRLTGRGKHQKALEDEVAALQETMAKTLADIVIAKEDIALEAILGRALLHKQKTMGVAESCTGGTIGHYMTMVPGSSAYFKGGIVSYANELKINLLGVPAATIADNGAVSEPTVIAMVQGAINVLQVDYAVAVSGVLGPDGATDRVPVGLVWIAVGDKDTVKAREFRFHYDRERNKEMAAKTAMLFLLKFVNSRRS
jgi:nicotinamide-nucleotide amidase